MAIELYDPLHAPNAEEWQAMDEDERIQLVLDYHVRSGIELPNVKVHATLHVIVENQIALADEIPVQLKAQQLMAQGLDRHDAIHAIASVLINHLHETVRDPSRARDPNERYFAALRLLNARKWLRSS